MLTSGIPDGRLFVVDNKGLKEKAYQALVKAKATMTFLQLSNRLGTGTTTPARWVKRGPMGEIRISPVYARLILEKLRP